MNKWQKEHNARVEKLSKPRRFFFHFNKPASAKAKTPKMSVHVNNKCFIVDKIDCRVPTESKTNKRQPRVVMQGFANTFTLVHEIEGTDNMIIENVHYL
jgi:hypothetical protein